MQRKLPSSINSVDSKQELVEELWNIASEVNNHLKWN